MFYIDFCHVQQHTHKLIHGEEHKQTSNSAIHRELTWSPFHLVGSCTVTGGGFCGTGNAGTLGAAVTTGGIVQMLTLSGEMPLPVEATSYQGCVMVARHRT